MNEYRPHRNRHKQKNNPTVDFWGSTINEITLLPHIAEEAFKGIEEFSYLEICLEQDIEEFIAKSMEVGKVDDTPCGKFLSVTDP